MDIHHYTRDVGTLGQIAFVAETLLCRLACLSGAWRHSNM